ncbi:hypothetical protein CYY_000130 [Polysphondylium violaceum]|uniref:NmrA-like family domain-containing protein 1 n=1 Tax=Polysphondylium violaceum TaxID=133409 RepID=A0A8J4Q496_9MYCE|nr:hypothetical protein CYY_000130 [Polysphondylium violaceum]
MSKIVSVFGATGSQGGAVVEALLKDGKFKVRALTRNVDSPKAQALKAKGAEVVKADLDDSVDQLAKALEGSYGVFLVTDFWTVFQKELEQGKKAADAALKAHVKHLVFSTLSHCIKLSHGKLSVPHFDLKAEIEQHIRDLSAKNPEFVSSFVLAPFYAQNLSTYFVPRKGEDGSYSLSLPLDPSQGPMEIADINDIGPIVSGIFNDPKKFSGVAVPFQGSVVTGEQIAEIISKTSGKKVSFNFVPPKVFATFFPGAEEMATMFQFYSEFGSFPGKDVKIAQSLATQSTLEQFLTKNPIKLE